jgi:eukaryotic-like serine/threonine-protein kinase
MVEYISGLQIGAKIGNGHFGEVFEGTDPAHGKVAVKVLSREAHYNDADWQLYKEGHLKEAQHLSKATHRNVVRVHHVVEGDSGNSVVICMEFCPGGSLGSVAKFS